MALLQLLLPFCCCCCCYCRHYLLLLLPQLLLLLRLLTHLLGHDKDALPACLKGLQLVQHIQA
jgi:hypothetical protein